METIRSVLDYVLHLDTHLDGLVAQLGPWFYALMFLIVFCETGLVVTPILPGDSLLFALGAFAARGTVSLPIVMALLCVAAILGDTVNYSIGSWLAPRLLRGEKIRFLKQEHLDRTHEFFERYGGKTIILARFVPIVRTFAPFVAGMGRMTYPRFMLFNVTGGAGWVLMFVLAGYFFGNVPMVKNNFTMVMLVIVVLSVLPGLYEFIRASRRR